jgi:capsular exopolysaccharide synthesis family protein
MTSQKGEVDIVKNKLTQYRLITENLSSRAAEAYRVLRTNIQFMSLDKPIKTLLFTSTAPGEGKSTTAANLAIAFAQAGQKTLLIDTDLRRPMVHKIFNISEPLGLTDLLLERVNYATLPRDVFISGLRVIPAGALPPNPAEVLGSFRMKEVLKYYSQHFDYIILDSPPTLAVTDSSVLSTMVDGVVFVVSADEVSIEKVKKAKSQLESVKAKILGVVLNGVEKDTRDDYYYYYQRASR